MAIESINKKIYQNPVETETTQGQYDPIKSEMKGIKINTSPDKDTVSFGAEENKKEHKYGILPAILGIGAVVALGFAFRKPIIKMFSKKAGEVANETEKAASEAAANASKATEGAASEIGKAGEGTSNTVADSTAKVTEKQLLLPAPSSEPAVATVKETRPQINELGKSSEPIILGDGSEKTLLLPAPSIEPVVAVKKARPQINELEKSKEQIILASPEKQLLIAAPVEAKVAAEVAQPQSAKVVKLMGKTESLVAERGRVISELDKIPAQIAKNRTQHAKIMFHINELRVGITNAKSVEELTAHKKSFKEFLTSLDAVNNEHTYLQSQKALLESQLEHSNNAVKSSIKKTTRRAGVEKRALISKSNREARRMDRQVARAEKTAQKAATKEQRKLSSEIDRLLSGINLVNQYS